MVSTRRSRSATKSPEGKLSGGSTPQSTNRDDNRKTVHRAGILSVKKFPDSIAEENEGDLRLHIEQKDAALIQPIAVPAGKPTHVLEEEGEDDDSLLLNTDLETLRHSIRIAIISRLPVETTKHVLDSQERKDKVSDHEEDEPMEEEAAPGSARLSIYSGGPESVRIMNWRPRVEVPKLMTTREVHQREATPVDKETGLSKQLMVPPRDNQLLSKAQKKAAPDTAGRSWYNLPSTKIDEAMKQELRLLRLRGAYDPKRFYKSDVSKLPKYFQMGTVVDSAVDFYGGRLTNAQRKGTLTEQLLADQDVTHARKKRYNKIQEQAQKYVPSKKRKEDHLRALKNIKHASR
ncbi:hypothetical protein CEUSTIGMA_g6307.t1 [Chlamydomonas eustigma]|uniref:Fcf2 pre-rRNA processing C-terminal domain-containing protein n=1 Tax=Chlamydomonas eustigma TaxID=1157962 RepID=A0A250X706_9CHLO|nr:hypothetical protein CEUSTIGMA_g6307.t1 [Chlamydomonas eustigma]|eukprot:GAX78868.1 hypothetical protein CEUSTIGMA_g6307.t1 [Chlamydomonas eustigma]